MNHQDKRLLVQKYGLSQGEVAKVINMVRSGRFTIDSAARYIIKDRKQ